MRFAAALISMQMLPSPCRAAWPQLARTRLPSTCARPPSSRLRRGEASAQRVQKERSGPRRVKTGCTVPETAHCFHAHHN